MVVETMVKRIMAVIIFMWTLLETTMVAAGASEPAGINLTSYPVRLIQSGKLMGDFFQAKHLALSDSDTYHSFLADKACACRIACWTHPPCIGSSSEAADGGKLLCRLTKVLPHNTTLMNVSDAIYTFKTDMIPHFFSGIQEDGHYYFLSKQYMFWNPAKSYCERFPGHRLAIFHTVKQDEIMLNIHQKNGYINFWLDLSYEASLIYRWGDGTLVEDNPGYSALKTHFYPNEYPGCKFVVWWSAVHDTSPSNYHYPLCQVILHHENW